MTVALIFHDQREMPERLRRLEYVFQRRPIYFITTSTSGRRKILANTDIHTSVIDFAEKGPEHGAWLGAYVIMPDHLHTFVVIDDQRIDLPTWTKSLKNVLSKVPPPTQNPVTTLAKRFLRSRPAQSGILLAKVGLCSRKSRSCRIGKELERMAIPWANL
jgi:REP element-mobilizing transposase RayT